MKYFRNAHDVKIQERIADKEREIFQKKMEFDEVQRRMDVFKLVRNLPLAQFLGRHETKASPPKYQREPRKCI